MAEAGMDKERERPNNITQQIRKVGEIAVRLKGIERVLARLGHGRGGGGTEIAWRRETALKYQCLKFFRPSRSCKSRPPAGKTTHRVLGKWARDTHETRPKHEHSTPDKQKKPYQHKHKLMDHTSCSCCPALARALMA